MGCDIHFFVEVRQKDGKWKSVDKWVKEDGYTHVDYNEEYYGNRNYDLFAILANVRNGRGFAGIKTGEGFNYIDEPRGIPSDVSPEVKECYHEWNGDGHSHSWFTLKELKAFNWNQVTKHQGFVNERGYKYYREHGKPCSWCGGVDGRDVKKITIAEMDAVIDGRLKLTGSLYTLVKWEEPYSDSVGTFLTETIPAMEKLGKDNDVRAVFWFDN